LSFEWYEELETEFIRLLTIEGPTQDKRRREFNQPLFDPETGWPVYSNTTLRMVMDKFAKAVKNVSK
jgi:hypothetical protein